MHTLHGCSLLAVPEAHLLTGGGFVHLDDAQVSSVEDAKSEIVKIFQEAWEKEHGFEWEDQGPPIQRYAEDILRA